MLRTPPHTQVNPGKIYMPHAVCDGAQQPRSGATGRAKAAREWKRARAHYVLSESDDEGDEGSDDHYSDPYGDLISDDEGLLGTQFPSAPTPATAQSEVLGADAVCDTTLFDPDNLRHPRSSEWEPSEHIAQNLALRVRKSLSQKGRNKLRAKCPIPIIPDAVAKNPKVDPQIVQFLAKTSWKPKKGLDHSLQNCQDKFLDTLGPVTKFSSGTIGL
ncbi:Hypothetical predicted protein [Pelobates cultripes]|uniref:Uncharacterized protein n=1 Tax=Pelobates cultripes TaxID=61616 RepID=A0AAD1VNU2_PELCU|nr:Hypothetical predicted protein [Pelobates cultripes]